MTSYDLLSLAQTPIQDEIPAESLTWALSNPPFVSVPGTINFRALGPVTRQGAQLRPNVIYRCGNVGRITEEGKQKLANELGVKKIFDFRHSRELKGSPPPVIEGVEVVWVDNYGTQPSKFDPTIFAEGEAKVGNNFFKVSPS
jgi:hypothetical protein